MNTREPKAVQNIHATSAKEIHATHDCHLMEEVVGRMNLIDALKQVERNAGAPGIDGMKTTELKPFLMKHWHDIRIQLLNGTYKPSPVRRVEIPKPDGGIRLLGIPTVLDRFIQQAIAQVLTPIFEPTFSEYSYGFRPERNALQAVRQVKSYMQEGKKYVVDIDLEKFFDRVNHDILMSKVYEQVKDVRMLRIIRRYLMSGVMINGCCVRTEEGTPQGGPISPLLANIMLTDLDRELEKRGLPFARYADDCNIYVASERAGKRVFARVCKFIQERLKLRVNAEKSAVARPWKRKFLGFTFAIQKGVQVRLAPRTMERVKDKIRDLTRGSVSIAMQDRIKKLNEYLIGWSGYFRVAQAKTPFEDLDKWIRARLRKCMLKLWRECKTKLRELRALGLTEEWAKEIAYSRKGPWRLVHTYQIHTAMDNKYWQEMGLVSLADRYRERRIAL